MTSYSPFVAFLVLFVSGIRALYVLVREMIFWTDGGHPQADMEGPEKLLWAPIRTKFLYDGNISGDNLIFTAHVADLTNQRVIPHAHVEAWHNHPTEEWYSNWDYQFRGEFITNENGTIEIHTKKPVALLIQPLYQLICKFRQLLGKPKPMIEQVAKRPAHIHWRISAPGYRPLYTQTYFEEDNWGFELNHIATSQSKMMHHRRNTTLKVPLTKDQNNDWRGEFTFLLQPC